MAGEVISRQNGGKSFSWYFGTSLCAQVVLQIRDKVAAYPETHEQTDHLYAYYNLCFMLYAYYNLYA
jgi:hypothetical protein